MIYDFYISILTGWSILFFFWIGVLLFIFLRKPPKSKFTKGLTIKSLVIFIFGYLLIIIFARPDSFFIKNFL